MKDDYKMIPYGISNYRTIATQNYVYVDKTRFIERMEGQGAPYIFFLRPRRFGKSLFTSVLNCYYDVAERDRFEEYFGGTYIGRNPTKNRNRYLMLNFNFSGIGTDRPDELEAGFCKCVRAALDIFIQRYGFNVTLSDDRVAANLLNEFFSRMASLAKNPIYVVIDEYAHFANDLLSFRIDLFRASVSRTGFVRAWYEVLKTYTATTVERIFATGVSPITLDSMTSGFNIASDLTLEEDFNEMMGFTAGEVRGLIQDTAQFDVTDEEIDGLMDVLAQNYNGYLFNKRTDTQLFNSNMILHHLKTYSEERCAPDELIDGNTATDYGKLGQLFALAGSAGYTTVLESILDGEELPVRMTAKFSMERDFTSDDLKSLLFYMGFLTISREEMGDTYLKIPNYVMVGLYFEYFRKMLEDDMKLQLNTGEIKAAIGEIAKDGTNEKFVKLIEGILASLSNRDYRNMTEKSVHHIMYAYLRTSPAYLVKSEYEVPGGFIDIALLPNHRFTVGHYALIEVKHVKKGDYEKKGGEKLVEEKLAEAQEQLGRYQLAPEMEPLPGLKKWALVFAGDECVRNVEV